MIKKRLFLSAIPSWRIYRIMEALPIWVVLIIPKKEGYFRKSSIEILFIAMTVQSAWLKEILRLHR